MCTVSRLTSVSGKLLHYIAMMNSAVMKNVHLFYSTLLVQYTPIQLYYYYKIPLFITNPRNSPFSVLSVSISCNLPLFLSSYLRGQVAKQQPAAASGGNTIAPS